MIGPGNSKSHYYLGGDDEVGDGVSVPLVTVKCWQQLQTHLKLLKLTCLFTETSLDLDEAKQQILDQLALPVDAQDVPLLMRLHRATFTKRRAEIATFKDGQVSELADNFPLMKVVRFVSEKTLFLAL